MGGTATKAVGIEEEYIYVAIIGLYLDGDQGLKCFIGRFMDKLRGGSFLDTMVMST